MRAGRRRSGAGRRMVLAALLVLVSSIASAQVDPNVARGISPSGSYESGGIDTVNLFNGNLVLAIPLGGGYPVDGGLSYALRA